MSASEIPVRRPMLDALVSGLQGRGAGRPIELARRLGPPWTEDGVIAALAELFSGGVVGHNHELGFWWVA
jgi:hypothetical protein